MMEQKESNDAWYSELLTPMRTPVKLEDDATKGTGVSLTVRGHPPLCPRECAREKHTVYWCGLPATWILYLHWTLRFLTMSGQRS